MRPRAIIFAGPTLPPAARPMDDSFAWRPPAQQGEVYRAALTRPAAIGIVDGYFEVVPTVWHKEILWAMAHGIAVYGAASIGALRAAELDSFGMRGIGQIYRDFRDGVLTDDDEVAVIHAPEELGYRPLSEAMVDIRATLAAAVRGDVIGPDDAARLAAIAKGFFYKERSWATILTTSDLPATARQALGDWLPVGRVNQKRDDAEEMLDTVRTYLAAGADPPRVAWRFSETAAWRTVKASSGSTRSLPEGPIVCSGFRGCPP